MARIIRKPELLKMVGLSDATVWRMERAGKFPRRVQLGASAVGWLDSEIESWFASKASERTAPAMSLSQQGDHEPGS